MKSDTAPLANAAIQALSAKLHYALKLNSEGLQAACTPGLSLRGRVPLMAPRQLIVRHLSRFQNVPCQERKGKISYLCKQLSI